MGLKAAGRNNENENASVVKRQEEGLLFLFIKRNKRSIIIEILNKFSYFLLML
jgi:hypothetical protein